MEWLILWSRQLAGSKKSEGWEKQETTSKDMDPGKESTRCPASQHCLWAPSAFRKCTTIMPTTGMIISILLARRFFPSFSFSSLFYRDNGCDFCLLVSKDKIMFSNKLSHVARASSDTWPASILQVVDRSKIQGIVGGPPVDGGWAAGDIVCREGGARDEPLLGQTD